MKPRQSAFRILQYTSISCKFLRTLGLLFEAMDLGNLLRLQLTTQQILSLRWRRLPTQEAASYPSKDTCLALKRLEIESQGVLECCHEDASHWARRSGSQALECCRISTSRKAFADVSELNMTRTFRSLLWSRHDDFTLRRNCRARLYRSHCSSQSSPRRSC